MFDTSISDSAANLVSETLKSTFVSAGKMADRFETELSSVCKIGRPVSVNSGTAALHLALVAAGVGKGDEVIIPAQTFIATGLAVLYVGATPVFADIQYDTGNIDPKSIKDKVTDRTKAIIPVHWGGYPCDMDEIQQIANEHNLIVIEDAAHALLAFYAGKYVGNISDYTCFSFQAIKQLTTGDGGAVCSLTHENESKLRKLRWFNIDRENDKPNILGERVYNSQEVGYKYHMNDIAASIGVGNLSSVSENNIHRELIARQYNKGLNLVSGLTMFERLGDRIGSNWLYGLHVENREDFIRMMKGNDISTSVVHLGIDDNDIFGGKDESLVNQRKFDSTQIHIPIHCGLSDEDVDKIITTIKSGW